MQSTIIVPFWMRAPSAVSYTQLDVYKRQLLRLQAQGKENGVEGLEILNREQALALEPNITEQVEDVLYAPTAGIVCPFGLNIAMAENACANGVDFRFDTEVDAIEKVEGGYLLKTDSGDYKARYVVNAAGVYADRFHNMVSSRKLHICLLYTSSGNQSPDHCKIALNDTAF